VFQHLAASRAAEAGLSETNLIPEDIKLWTESMLWDGQGTLSSGVGYKDNILLSPFNPHGSPFFINGLDLTAIRLPLDGWQIEASFTGNDIRYWHNVGANREDLFLGTVKIVRELPNGWQAGLEVRGLYEDQVLDISTSAGTPATALVQGYGITGQPSLRKDFAAGWWLKLEVPVTRWVLDSPLDDYWDLGPVVTAGHDFGKRADLALSYGVTYEPHDSWVALDQYGGVPAQPQLLNLFEQRVGLAWHQYWDVRRQWRSTTQLTYIRREDNGGGYFNYDEYEAAEELRWQTTDWQITARAEFGDQNYPVQKIGPHFPQTLYRDTWNVSLEAERRLFKELKAYARVEHDQAISNEAGNAGDYAATTVSGGLRWVF
jgi:hypothetical protein